MLQGVGRILLLVGLSVTCHAIAQETETELMAMSFDELLNATVEVGTRRSDKKLQHSLVPVDAFSKAQLQATGFHDLGKALQRLLPYVNRPQPAITDGTDHVPPTTLRGMEADQTLVLINGKRLHQAALVHLNGSIGRGSQAVDLQSIPMALVDRVEILRDGAAAQYGSDAIAGIINIVLSKNTDWQVQLRTGVSQEDDGEHLGVTMNKGWQLADNGFVTTSLSVLSEQASNRAAADPRQQYFSGDPRNEVPELQNPVNHRFGQPGADALTLAVNSEIALGDSHTAMLFGHWHSRQSEAAGFFRRAQDNRNVRSIYPDGFLPLIAPELTDININLGLKNNAETGWQWEVANTYGSNKMHYFVQNSLNTSLGEQSPGNFDSGQLKYWQNTVYLNANNQINDDWFVALGAEIRYENYAIVAGEPASWLDGGIPILDGPNMGNPAAPGAQVFPGFQPENEFDQSRTNLALYADVEVDLTPRWQGQLALRYEDNENFGSSLDYKLATGYQFDDNLLFRLSGSTGFRAPSLGQSLFSAIASLQDSLGNQVRAGTFPVEHPVARALGAKPLSAEQSSHLAAGLHWQLSPQLQMSIDWFYTEVDDRIALTGNVRPNADVYGNNVVALLGELGVSQARFFSNTFDTRTQGIDANLKYNTTVSDIRWLLDLRYHHNHTDVLGDIQLPDTLANVDPSALFGVNEITRIESAQPGDNVNLTMTAQWQNLEVSNRIMRFGSIVVGDSSYAQEWLWDFAVTVEIMTELSISTGIHNITDNYPDHPANNGSVFREIFPYSASAPFGYMGRYYYLQLNYQW